MNQDYNSWGLYPAAKHKNVIKLHWISDIPDLNSVETSVLPYGLGRSYGDNCLNNGNTLLDTSGISRFIEFDKESGIIKCEAGVSFEEILKVIVPNGWFFPVTPGTKFVTVGGAIANDIHGKNHHAAGTFGKHVIRFELLKSDGEKYICSASENIELYRATIGGMGLTGLILWAQFKLKPIENAYIDTETIKFKNLDEFFELSEDSSSDYEYIVSWVDCTSRGKSFGRGLFFRGNHSVLDKAELPQPKRPKRLPFPFTAPAMLLNRLTLKIANGILYHSQFKKHKKTVKHYDPFFYPLDSILNWNRMYGRHGFFQYQCVVPHSDGGIAIRQILECISKSGKGSFLAVLKTMGGIKSPGALSFPREGVTLALDFANHGEKTQKLFSDLDKIVKAAGGALYPCKDARMPKEMFRFSYTDWNIFKKYIDPKFSSSFWRRVNGEKD
ncbi:MAG: FAD-binding oxidoreductase [Candidatus Neomarinimicrobiota bacterium]